MNLVHVVVIQFRQETYKEKQQDLHIVSVDLDKTLSSHQKFDMEHQANDRHSTEVRQSDTGYVQRSDD